VEKRAVLAEGKAKIVYLTDDPDKVIFEYKDDATAFNGLKKGTIAGKGIINNSTSAIFFQLLESQGIPTHFIKKLNEKDMLVKRIQILPIEVVVRNIAAGSLAKKLGLKEGSLLPITVVEYYYKNDELADPMINQYHIAALNLASNEELEELTQMALKVNRILSDFLIGKGIQLVDFKLEFGRYKGSIILGDEISPDTCRFWDIASGKKLDKDRFRQDLGNVEQAYQTVLERISRPN
jgi:phosphoribosylaminoimidazole-succinocarboxamide synthase